MTSAPPPIDLDRLPEPLGYFAEWGATAWTDLLRTGLRDLGDLRGRRVLEIGCRHGRLACLLGLLGADVTGVDLNPRALDRAREEIARWRLADRVRVRGCGPGLEEFEPGSFDLVVSKSVLVLVDPLPPYLARLASLLRPGGRVLFLENTPGPAPVRILRHLRHRRWKAWRDCRYFDRDRCGMVERAFDDVRVKRRTWPPVVLLTGRKRVGGP